MELNEITRKLPPHLLQFVVDQPYKRYTPIDQAVWRYVMRKNYAHLSKVAHPSYVEGLKKAGLEIEKIPTMYGMNRILQKIGWAAVAVDGFIPPGAFMEFTAYKVLVIAADIRTLEHIEYTPAPDIIHESAGHAPMIADPDFADYLVKIGKVGAKAFSSKKDYELYEAIRHLSIIKENPNTKPKKIVEAEHRITEISADMGPPSEMALLRNLHWWTVEYGLIGSVKDHRIYGAGLLSSIGESETCLMDDVVKLPYSIEAAYVNYDITKPQPQLFVTPDFKHLSVVLEEYTSQMAFKEGGVRSIDKAIASENIATLELSSGLQISAVFSQRTIDDHGKVILIRSAGPTACAYQNKEIVGYGKSAHAEGMLISLGKLHNVHKNPENLSEYELVQMGFRTGEAIRMDLESGIRVEGYLGNIAKVDDRVLFLVFKDALISFKNNELHKGDIVVPLAERVIGAFAGPADIEAFQPSVTVPGEKTIKIRYDSKALKLQKLYGLVREVREMANNEHLLYIITSIAHQHYPDDWLLNLEILELAENRYHYKALSEKIRKFLLDLKERRPEFSKLIDDGLALMEKYV